MNVSIDGDTGHTLQITQMYFSTIYLQLVHDGNQYEIDFYSNLCVTQIVYGLMLFEYFNRMICAIHIHIFNCNARPLHSYKIH